MRTERLSLGAAAAAFRILYVAFIITASLETLVSAHGAAHHPVLLPALAIVEIAAALLYALPATELAGCILLLVVFAIAQALALAVGEFTLRFVFYAGTAVFALVVARAAKVRAANPPVA